MSQKVAFIIGGPALVQYRGASFYSQGDISVQALLETFPVVVDRFQEVDQRVREQPIKIQFTPAGEWENLAVLYPYASTILGELITPVRTFGTVTAAADTIQIVAHGLPAGSAIRPSSSGTLPAGLTALALYYVNVVDADTIKLYDTYAHAIAGGATGLVDITGTGSGTHKLVVNEPLTIHPFDGQEKIVFHNAAVTAMPNTGVSTTKTLLGQVEFEAFLKEGANWSDANSRFTISNASLTDTTFDPASILTQAATMAWGSAPWDSFSTKNGVVVSYALTLEPIMTDTDGILTRRFAGLTVQAKAQPMGLSAADLTTKMLLQDTGAKRGRSLSGSDLNISATNFYTRLYGAALVGGPLGYGSKTDRIGELTWQATRTFSSGVPNPLFFVGTSAPP
jgi:hypothetical protein